MVKPNITKPAGFCYLNHRTGESDHMNAHICTKECDESGPRADLSALHDAGMPTDIQAAVKWIQRLIKKCDEYDQVRNKLP